ncbi:hypothetical protein ACFV0W_15165, partial [Streptomyces anulatus]
NPFFDSLGGLVFFYTRRGGGGFFLTPGGRAGGPGATFLLLGYGLRLAEALPALAGTLVGVGWFSLAVAAVTALVSVVALYRTAAKQSADGTASVPDRYPAVEDAREAWLAALRDRGIRPFLLQQLTEAAPPPGPGDGRGSRFSSPTFAGPDFSGPGFEGSGHRGSGRPAPDGSEPRR